MNVQNVCDARHQRADGFSLLNLPVMKLHRHSEVRGVRPNYYSFEKYWCCSTLIQNGELCVENTFVS